MSDTADDARLIMRIGEGAHAVSALSSLLRTMQAAVRECAARTDEGASLFDRHPAPLLTAEFAHDGEAGTRIMLQFCDGTGAPIPELSESAFGAFMRELGVAISAQSQRTLWGASTRPRPPSGDSSSRVHLFLDDLTRLGTAAIVLGDRKIEVRDGSIWVNE